MAETRSPFSTIANQDGCAILNAESGTITILNTTGSFIWQALERGEEPDSIAEALAHETDEPLSQVRRDLQWFLDAMRMEGFLTPR